MRNTGGLLGVVLQMAQPLFGRVAAVIATALVAQGVAEEHANLFVNTLGAFSLVALDVGFVLIKRYQERKGRQNGSDNGPHFGH